MVQRLICKRAVELIRSATMIDVLCIGTPKVVGDSIGPRVGLLLKTAGLPDRIKIIGCMDDPVHRINLHDKLQLLRDYVLVICVDAAIGENYPLIMLRTGSMQPGAALTDEQPMIGEVSMLCSVAEDTIDLLFCSEDYVNSIAEEAAAILTTLLST